ncbi:hypothetical protein ACQPX6_22505 [Actinomycetospora sp. CA-101289]|uniref:hypothetical protein n=1 Tax=Actinomycetospora sp. CA-101289 TaxID=3239893 RepID=UPI003D9555B8
MDRGFLEARRRSPGGAVALAVLALLGLVTGVLIAGRGTEGILDEFAVDGTVFGVTIATLALSLEDLLLTAEPQRRGAPEIAVANVIGSVVFSVTVSSAGPSPFESDRRHGQRLEALLAG